MRPKEHEEYIFPPVVVPPVDSDFRCRVCCFECELHDDV
jgi:hypothetical protein